MRHILKVNELLNLSVFFNPSLALPTLPTQCSIASTLDVLFIIWDKNKEIKKVHVKHGGRGLLG